MITLVCFVAISYSQEVICKQFKLKQLFVTVIRPCLGCRTLIEREVGKFALAIGKELLDWVVGVRIKSAQLLSQVVLHAEHSITQDLHKIIVPMSKAAMDEEVPAVIHYV